MSEKSAHQMASCHLAAVFLFHSHTTDESSNALLSPPNMDNRRGQVPHRVTPTAFTKKIITNEKKKKKIKQYSCFSHPASYDIFFMCCYFSEFNLPVLIRRLSLRLPVPENDLSSCHNSSLNPIRK